MNRVDKPKMTSKALVEKLQNEKGVTFNCITKEEAVKYLSERNNYLRTAAYRKNFQKYLKGPNEGKYIGLDFFHLMELSTIDMHLRDLITKMCIDIEHDLKVQLLQDVESDVGEDGYTIVDVFLMNNPKVVDRIAQTSVSTYTGNLVNKYFEVEVVQTSQPGKTENRIKSFDCPVWVLLELLSFGDFILFYKYYYDTKGKMPVDIKMINLVKSLRNGCAHNNCLLANLNPGTANALQVVDQRIQKMSDINKNQRQKKLKSRAILELVAMFCVYNDIVSEKVKETRVKELKKLFYDRFKRNEKYFQKNELLISTYNFVAKVIRNLFG